MSYQQKNSSADQRPVKDPNLLKEGEMIRYFCKYKNRPITAEVLGHLDNGIEKIVVCMEAGQDLADIVDLAETDVYVGLWGPELKAPANTSPADKKCECGARHTSNPTFHLAFCPISS